VGVKLGQIFKKGPPRSNYLRTLETVSRVIKPRKANGGTVPKSKGNAFYQTTNLFP